jgi:predicted nucleic acid-binding protein
VERGGVRAVTSTLSLMEVLVRPKQLGQQKVADDYGFLLRTFPNLTLRNIDDTCAEKAADLRTAYGIRPPDALQIGTAMVSGATCFVTNDEKLKRVKEIEVVVLNHFA